MNSYYVTQLISRSILIIMICNGRGGGGGCVVSERLEGREGKGGTSKRLDFTSDITMIFGFCSPQVIKRQNNDSIGYV